MKRNSDQLMGLIDLDSFVEIVRPGASILTAVSGGADSVAMMLALQGLSAIHKINVTVLHVNHGLRPEAVDEENFVRETCLRQGLAFIGVKVEQAQKTAAQSPEQFWRRLRYDQFEKCFSAGTYDFLALGHTQDDLAETFLFHLARGTGLDGLCFSFYKRTGALPIIRPLWKTKRDEIERVLNSMKQPWTVDPSNADTRYSRNLIRKIVMPALQQINPAVAQSVFHVSEDITAVLDERSSSSAQTQPIVHDVGLTELPDVFNIEKSLLEDSDENVIAAAIRDFVKQFGQNPMTRRQTVHAVSMIKQRKTGLVSLTGSMTLVVGQELVWVYPGDQPDDSQLAQYFIQQHGGLAATLGAGSIKPALSPCKITAIDGKHWKLTWDPADQLIIRNRIPGDKVGSKLLAKLLIEHKIPWYLRDYVLVAEDLAGRIAGIAILNQSKCEALNRRIGSIIRFNWSMIES